MSGGGGGGREVVTSAPSQPQYPEELRPYIKAVGQRGTAALNFPQFNLQNFANDFRYQVPGLSNQEQWAQGQIQNRENFGYDTPQASRSAENTFGNFASGDMGNSPAVQQAVAGLQSQIVPAVQNQAAKSGLAQSGFLPQEVGRSYASALVPLYTQGMQNQMSAAQNLNQMGESQFGRQNQLIQDASSFGELSRGLQNADEQSKMEQYLRQREFAQGMYAPLGQVPTSSSASPEMVRKSSGGSGGLFKMLLPFAIMFLGVGL